MYSLSFPNMFSINKTNILEGKDATMSNLKLLLGTEKTGLFGDPYFGTILKRMIYQQNDRILRDIVTDEIYTTIITFMPQVRLTRKDVRISIEKNALIVNVKCQNVIDSDKLDYTIKLFGDGE